jgi:ketosteroid isomerase-like protein
VPPENLEIVRSVYARWGRGAFDASLEVFDPGVVFVLDPGFPEAGTYRGIEEITEYTRGFLEPWTEISITAEDLSPAGENVLATVLQRGVGSKSEIATEFRYYQAWSFRGRKVIRLENFRERANALESLGLAD